MTRIILFTALFALCTVTLATSVAPAFAEDEKGGFTFFNRNKNAEKDRNKPTDPVHMKPNIPTSGRGDFKKPFDFSGARSYTKPTTYEDSPIFEESLAASQSFDAWNGDQLASANATAKKLQDQMLAQTKMAEQMAQQEQMQIIAQSQSRMTAGAAPGPGNQAIMQAMRNATLPQSIAATPKTGTSTATPEPAAEEPVRERKPRQFFNRTE